MFPYNEYLVHERAKDLLREAKQVRLARENLERIVASERVGALMLRWGARLLAPKVGTEAPCRVIRDDFGRTISVCAQA
jgi:hypothetical protein